MDEVKGCIIGAGVIGLAFAYQIGQYYKKKGKSPGLWLLLDKASDFGTETSSRSSEVIHSGLYYPQQSFKTKFCLSGNKQMYEFCRIHQIPHNKIGKLIIASKREEKEKIKCLLKNAQRNGIDQNSVRLLNSQEVLSIEPQVFSESALLSSTSGIVDSHAFMSALLSCALDTGIEFVPNTRVTKIDYKHSHFVVSTENIPKSSPYPNTDQTQFYAFKSRYLINSAGFESLNLAKTLPDFSQKYHESLPKLTLYKGHYASYSGKTPFKHLIYPLPSKVGLGIHATLDLSNQVRFGPDSLKVNQINYDMNTFDKDKFIESIRSYFPSLNEHKLMPSYCGIRPKLTHQNQLLSDFVIHHQQHHHIQNLIHVFGIESPGLTSCLSLSEWCIKKHLAL